MKIKTKRIILAYVAAAYFIIAILLCLWYPTAFSKAIITLKATTFLTLVSVPFLLMIWMLISLLVEPRFKILRIILIVYASLITFFMAGALLFT